MTQTAIPLGKATGCVAGLWRYPVKSMAGEPLAAADVSWHGFAGDRRWAFVRSGIPQSGFPWLTIRERADMGQFHASFVDPQRPDKSPTMVRTPSGAVYDVADPQLARELSSQGVQVIRQDRGVFDTFPLSLITKQTIAHLAKSVGQELDVRRFRPNLLIDTAHDTPYAEDEWVGRVVRIGGLRMRIDKRDGRCAVITVDPKTSQRDPSILRAVVEEREGCLGVYGTTVEPGQVAVDDEVFVE